MTRELVCCVVLTCALFLTACENQDRPARDPVGVTGTDVQRESQEAFETLKAYTVEQRERYQEQVEARLTELDTQIDALRARAEDATAAVQMEIREVIQELQQQQEIARQKAAALRDASREAWSDLKGGLDAAVAELQQTYDRVRSRF